MASGSPWPARDLAARVMHTDLAVEEEGHGEEPEAGASGISIAFAVLAGWLTAAREDHNDPELAQTVLAWIASELGQQYARTAGKAAAILGEPGPDIAVEQLADELNEDFLPSPMWFTAGLVVAYGNGDIGWLRRYDIR